MTITKSGYLTAKGRKTDACWVEEFTFEDQRKRVCKETILTIIYINDRTVSSLMPKDIKLQR